MSRGAGLGLIAGGLALGVFAWWERRRAMGATMAARSDGATFTASLDSQPFPRQTRYPGVLVHVPPGYDPGRPLDLVVYFRGLGSCVGSVAASSATRCHAGGPLHHGSHLIELVDAARVNVVLVLPELQVESGSVDSGQFARPGGFRRFLDELLSGPLSGALGGPRSAADVRSVYLCSHSGGWAATASVLVHGEVDQVRGVALFDSLYGGSAAFQGFAQRVGLGEVEGGRFSSVYIGGAPQQNSERLARTLRGLLPASSLRVDTSRADLTDGDFRFPPVYFRLFRAEHSYVPEKVFPFVLAGADFDPIG